MRDLSEIAKRFPKLSLGLRKPGEGANARDKLAHTIAVDTRDRWHADADSESRKDRDDGIGLMLMASHFPKADELDGTLTDGPDGEVYRIQATSVMSHGEPEVHWLTPHALREYGYRRGLIVPLG